ncbi:MAG: hypothetical protein OEL20_04625 [Sulfuritalea sp.]|nr:hypothetical protein [Sulfuritalea sp.]
MPRIPAPAKKSPKPALHNVREVRLARGENQLQFWSRFGVTQSGGSRYETSRDIPVPTGALVMLYLTGTITDAELAKAIKTAKNNR